MKKVIVCFITLMFIICLTGCNMYRISSINTVKEITSLNFPSDVKIIYEIKDNVFMHGRLAQYYVIKLMMALKGL